MVGDGKAISRLSEGKPLGKKYLTISAGDIVRLGVLVAARPFYIPTEDGNETVQVTITRGSTHSVLQGHPRGLSCTFPGLGPTLHLPADKTTLPKEHATDG